MVYSKVNIVLRHILVVLIFVYVYIALCDAGVILNFFFWLRYNDTNYNALLISTRFHDRSPGRFKNDFRSSHIFTIQPRGLTLHPRTFSPLSTALTTGDYVTEQAYGLTAFDVRTRATFAYFRKYFVHIMRRATYLPDNNYSSSTAFNADGMHSDVCVVGRSPVVHVV